MEIRRLTANDYDELLEMLNYTFGAHYGREMDFVSTLPKMWIRDDEHMGKHVGIFEDGVLAAVIGIYKLPCVIGGERFDFYTTGNVCTRPEYQGRGYFSILFGRAMEEIEAVGADAARLGGSRNRYARYGFEPCGASYSHTLTEHNRIAGFGDIGGDIEFKEILEGDLELLEYCDRLYKKKEMYCDRGCELNFRDLYLALCSKHATPYIALRDGKPIGYISAVLNGLNIGQGKNGERLAEWWCEDMEDAPKMMCAWQRRIGQSIHFDISALHNELHRMFMPYTENCISESHHRYRIINFAGLANALIKVRAKKEKLPDMDYTLGISGYGSIRILVCGGDASVALTDRAPEITLSKSEATRLLFGQYEPLSVADVPAILRAVLPLPGAWCTQDLV